MQRERRLRAAARDRPRRPRADLEGPQVGVRRGRPDQPRLHRPGRRDPAHRAARGAQGDRRAVERLGRPRRQRLPRRRRQPAPARALRRLRRGAGDAAEKVSGAILDLCIEHGGSITGEHGVGMDKSKYMPRMYTDEDLDTMQLVRCAFDPDRRSPTPARSSRRRGCAARCPAGTRARTRCRKPASRRCSDAAATLDRTAREADRRRPAPRSARRGAGRPGRRGAPGLVARPADTDQVAEVMRAAAAHGLTVVPRGRGTKLTWGTAAVERRRGARRERARPGPRPRRPAT